MSRLLSVGTSTATAPCNRGESGFSFVFFFSFLLNVDIILLSDGTVNTSNAHRSKHWASEFNLAIPSVSRVSIHDQSLSHSMFFIPAASMRLQ